MASSQQPSPEAVALATQLDDLYARVKALEMRKSLAHASIDGGNLPIYDTNGNLQMTVGLLPDGTFGPNYYNPNPPPVPALPTVTPTWGGLMIAHFGTTADGTAWPMDVSHIEIHLSSLAVFFPTEATLIGTFNGVNGGGLYAAMGLDAGVTYYVRLVAVNTSEKKSAATAAVSGEPDQVVSQAELDQIEAELQQVVEDLLAAGTANIFYNNTTDGDPVPVPTGDKGTWFRPDQGYKQYRWIVGDEWQAALLDTEAFAAGSITAALLDVGAVTADKIAANAITVDKLSVGSIGDNLILNGNFKDREPGPLFWPTGWLAEAVAGQMTTEVAGNDTYLLLTTPSNVSGYVYQHTDQGRIPVNPGDQFHVEVGASTPGGAGTYYTNMHCYDRTGALIIIGASGLNVFPFGTANHTTGQRPSASRSSTVFTVPDNGTTHVRFGVRPATASTTYRFDRFTVGKVTVSARIADGAITAEKVKAKAIIAGKIDTNAVRATNIEAGAITADKIHLGAKGFAVNDNSNFEQDAVDTEGVSLGRPYGWWLPYVTGAPTLSIETAAPLSGSKSARLNMPAGSVARLATATENSFQILPGEKWFVSVRVKAVGGNAVVGDGSHLTFHTANADPTVIPLAIFDSRVTWLNGPLAEIANGQEVTLTGTFTIPADRVRGAVSVRLGSRTAAGYYLVEDFVAHPAVDNTMVTDISAGKLTTGFIQAGQRIVAGTSLDGARTEMKDDGFFAYNGGGGRTFTVQGSDGTAVVGNPGGINISMSAYANIWNGNISQAMLNFNYPSSGWGSGQLFSQYWSDGGFNYAALRMTSPYTNWGNSAYLDVRQRSDGYSIFYLRAQEANFAGNTFIWGSGDGSSIDFRAFGDGFQFSDYSQTSRLRLMPQIGYFLVRAADASGNVQQMRLQGSTLSFSSGGHLVYYDTTENVPGFSHFDRNLRLGFGGGELTVTNYWANNYKPIYASAFVVNSDPERKFNAEAVDGASALEAINALTVYDYDMEGVPGREPETIEPHPQPKPPLNRARGVMSTDVEAVLPDAVTRDTNGSQLVSLYDLLATTMAAVQELAAETTTLRNDLATLKESQP